MARSLYKRYGRVAREHYLRTTAGGRLRGPASGWGGPIQAFPGTVSPGAANYIHAYSGPVLNEILALNNKATVSPWGTYPDWLELYNPEAASVSLAGLGLGDSFAPDKRWVFPAGSSIEGGGHLIVWCDASHAATTANGPVLNSGFNLSGSSGEVILFNTNSQPVDSISYGFQIPDLSLGRVAGDWSLLAVPTPKQPNSAPAALGSPANLRINEWMANPVSGDDWIEIFNADLAPVDIGGLYLTDDPSTAGIIKSPVPPLSYLNGRSWALWQADGSADKGANHTAFSLDGLGETIRLYDANLALLDVQDFGIQSTGVSEGRFPNGESAISQFPVSPSPEESNYLPLTNVVINEVLSHTDSPLEDAIELYNSSPQAVDLAGWYLSDSQSDPKRYRIPENTSIQGHAYRVFYQVQFGSADGEEDNPPQFSLNSARGDAVYLSEADAYGNLTGYRAGIKFGAAANGVAMGRYPTSVGVDFVALRNRSFGVDNPATVQVFRTGAGLTNALPLVGPIVISEIMYHPGGQGTNAAENPDLEFIELHNTAATNAPLYDPAHATNRWHLANGIDFEFPANTVIPAGACLVVVPFDPVTNTAAKSAFEARYGAGIPMAGPYSGRLSNSGETVELLRPDSPQTAPHPDAGFVPYLLVERISFTDTNPWPAAADGLGYSLTRASISDFGNDPVNWTASAPTPGTVGGFADSDSDGLPDWWEDAFGTLKNTPDEDADPDGDGLTNMQEYLAGTLPQDPDSNLKLSIANGAGFVLLQFSAASNRTYTVLFNDSPWAQTWLRLRDIDARGSNWQSGLTDAINSTNRFYRVVTPRVP